MPTIYPKIMSYLMHEIEHGGFKPYSKVPSGSELAAQFKTTGMTAARALNLLVAYEWLYRIKDEPGYYVCPPPIETARPAKTAARAARPARAAKTGAAVKKPRAR